VNAMMTGGFPYRAAPKASDMAICEDAMSMTRELPYGSGAKRSQ
jgi:hypothetical protein